PTRLLILTTRPSTLVLHSFPTRRSSDLAIMDQQQQATNPYQAFQVMNDPAYNIYSFKYDAAAGTLHTAAYFPNEMKAWYAIGSGDRKSTRLNSSHDPSPYPVYYLKKKSE